MGWWWVDLIFCRASVAPLIPMPKHEEEETEVGFLIYASSEKAPVTRIQTSTFFDAIRNFINRGSLSWSKSWQLLACHAYIFPWLLFYIYILVSSDKTISISSTNPTRHYSLLTDYHVPGCYDIWIQTLQSQWYDIFKEWIVDWLISLASVHVFCIIC